VEELAQLGVRVVLIGSGSAAELAEFARQYALGRWPLVLATDPTLGAFRAAGLVRSRARVLSPRSLAQDVRALLAGYRQTTRAGDAAQLGGTLLLDRGRLVHQHVSRSVGELVDMNDVVQAALALRIESEVVGRLV
jgi:AhpC/TSA antioxidant enzyme